MTKELSIKILLLTNLALVLFHTGVVMKWIPSDIVWGGREYEEHQILLLEGISLFVISFLIFILLIEGGYFRQVTLLVETQNFKCHFGGSVRN